MATLKEVADLANVPMLLAFQALKDNEAIDEEIRQRVQNSAKTLNYRLRITQIDVADFAGVAKGTVSYALNNSSLITETMRQRVMDAANTLGYRPNIQARNLRTNQASIIGYSWHVADDPSTMNNLLDRFIYQVTLSAEQENIHLLTFIQPQVDAYKVYDDLMSTNRVDGFILSDIHYHDPRIERLIEIHAPFVAFGGMYVEDFDFAYVDVDGKRGIELVVNHLIAQGHRRIAMMNYDQSGWPVGDAREIGYRSAMQAAGIEIQPDWIAYTPNILRSASAAAERLMNAKLQPTAVICANDVMAFGAKTYFDKIGLQVGKDVALTGYDDDPTSEFLGITSVHQPIDDVAAEVFRILMGEIIGKPLDRRQVVYNPTLVVRHSTRG